MLKRCLVLVTIVGWIACFCTGFGSANAQAPDKIVWKYAMYTPSEKTSTGAVSKWFFDEVEKRSQGRLVTERFMAESLVPAARQPDALLSGLCDATGIVPSYYPAKLPLYTISTMPGVLPEMDYGEGYIKFINIHHEWFETPALKAELAKWNAMEIGEYYPLYNSLLCKLPLPIRNLADLKGKKIRAAGPSVEALKIAGATPVFLATPEIYDAFDKGVIEAIAHSWEIFSGGYKWYEIGKHWTYGVPLGHVSCNLMIGRKSYDALPPDLQKVIQEVRRDLSKFQADHWEAKRTEAIELFKNRGITITEFPAGDSAKMRSMFADIWKATIDKSEAQGNAAGESFNSLQNIIKKHVPGYEIPYVYRK
jgi:TRAP-type C4-dicarboxylate transport system substrate-binding protein